MLNNNNDEFYAVYCSECRFFNHKKLNTIAACIKPVDLKQCLYSDNIGTWENRHDLRRLPQDINNNNDCTWFEESLSRRG